MSSLYDYTKPLNQQRGYKVEEQSDSQTGMVAKNFNERLVLELRYKVQTELSLHGQVEQSRTVRGRRVAAIGGGCVVTVWGFRLRPAGLGCAFESLQYRATAERPATVTHSTIHICQERNANVVGTS
ncbi:Hypothetical predicted protein [Scomber scombrus]|uniref:Uncharacterized protein n=1 Tax=Scomber scombrus TaxID=13677 RepID=A0AAV1MUW9_SCOSC